MTESDIETTRSTSEPVYIDGTTYSLSSIFLDETKDFYKELNYTTDNLPFTFSDNEGKSLCTKITHVSEVHRCNLTVYSFYPSGLLWFGTVCCIVFTIIGTTGNFISILALLRSKRLRNATTAFIVNLCLSDLLFCSFSIPLTAVTYVDKKWNGSDELCKLFTLLKFSNGIVSIFTVVAITMNRYILIVYPKIYPTFYQRRNTALMIFFLWFLPLFLLFLPYLELWGKLGYDPEVGDCGVMSLHGKSPKTFIFLVATILPSVLFIACYVKIYFVVSKSVRKVSRIEQRVVGVCSCGNGKKEIVRLRKNSCACKADIYVHFRDKKEFRLLRIVFVIFVFFVFSTFPLAYVKIFHKEYDLPVMNIVGYVAYFSSNVINPIIYIVMSEEYRRAYKELFCTKTVTVYEG